MTTASYILSGSESAGGRAVEKSEKSARAESERRRNGLCELPWVGARCEVQRKEGIDEPLNAPRDQKFPHRSKGSEDFVGVDREPSFSQATDKRHRGFLGCVRTDSPIG